jgi:hypothetical protein
VEALKPIRQPVRGRALHRLFWKQLGMRREIVHPALTALKGLASPAQVAQRRRLAAELKSAGSFTIPEDQGFLAFGPGELPGVDAAVDRCREIFQSVRESSRREEFTFNPNKGFLLDVLTGQGFREQPELVSFMVSRPVVDAVTHYLGTVPLLAGAALWWSPQNDTAASSQLFHLDNEDWKQVKVFINLFDTDAEMGPFTLLPANVSQRIVRDVGYVKGRIPDEQVEAAGGLDASRVLTGAPGSGAFVDTARCLHYGSRGNRQERLVLMFQFLRFDSPTESTFRFPVPRRFPGIELDSIQKLALGLR